MKVKSSLSRSIIRSFILLSVISIVPLFIFVNCSPIKKDSEQKNNADTIKGLKDFYKDFFIMGVAVSPNSVTGTQAELIIKHFGSLTAENVMKPALIHPEESRYSWDNADKIVNF